MRDILEQLLRAAGLPNPERAEELWAEYRAGGSNANTAFATLMAWYGGTIYRRIWGFVRSDAADDVFQDVLVKLHRHRAKLATFADAMRWLRAVATTQCVDEHRRSVRRKRRELARVVGGSSAPPEAEFELQEALGTALSKLSEREREAVALVYFDEMTRQDAAAVLGTHRDTFAKLLDGALAKLRAALSAVAVGVTAATTATVEAMLAARIPILLSSRLSKFVNAVWEPAPVTPHPIAIAWLPGKLQLLAGVVFGGLITVSISWALTSGSSEMKTASPPTNRARLGVERLETRDNPSGGLLDAAFGTNGVVTHSVGPSSDTAFDMALQSDGKIVLVGETVSSTGGTDFAVSRYNPDGSRDTTFGTGGATVTDLRYFDRAQAVTVLSNGKILVAGTITAWQGGKNQYDFAVVRYNADGTLDTTFGDGKKNKGIVVTDLGSPSDFVHEMVVQPDGKILVSGVSGARGYLSYALVRYNADSSLDASFGSGGKQITTIAAGERDADIALDGDGRIVLSGTSPRYDFVVARFLPGGQADPSFGSSGVVTTDFGGGRDIGRAITLQADGKIVVAGQTELQTIGRYGSVALARYNSDGTLDTTFGQGGTAIGTMDKDPTVGSDPKTDFAMFANAMTVQRDGKLLVGGRGGYRPEYGPANAFVLMRFNPDGTPDTGYGSLGTGGVVTPIGVGAEAQAIALQPDGKVILAGFTEVNRQRDFALARFLPSGPQVGSFVGPAAPMPAGDLVTLTAANFTNENSGATVTQVAFYRDSNGDGKLDASDELLGYGTVNGDGSWSLTLSTAGWAAGTYSLFAQATDSYGAPGDPVSLSLQLV